jgi:hypothetical protein
MDTLKTLLMTEFLKSYYKIFKNEKFKDDKNYKYVHLNFNMESRDEFAPDPILTMNPGINDSHESEEVENSKFIHYCLENAHKNIILDIKYEIKNYFYKKLKH